MPGGIAVCAIMRNEARYVVEWVAHYRQLGFDRILVYDNDSTDGTTEVLEQLGAEGIVELVRWPSGDRENPQVDAYADALARVRGASDWLMFADADEFLVLHGGWAAPEFLDSFDVDVGCVVINWRLFGSSGRQRPGSGHVTERFLLASEPDFDVNFHVKSIVRPALVTEPNVHSSVTSGFTVTADGTPVELEGQAFSPKVDLSVAQVNHYFTKSRDEYVHKANRGEANQGEAFAERFAKYSDGTFDYHDRNECVDGSALAYRTAVRQQLAEWAARPSDSQVG